MKIGINCGSGQRPFFSNDAISWIGIDSNPKWNPDIVADWNHLDMFADNSIDVIVSCHSIEHAGCGEADGFISESHRILKPGCSLIILVPDPKAIARRYLDNQLDEYMYNVLTYGAFMGEEADRHRWSYSRQGLLDYLRRLAPWGVIQNFDWRQMEGADMPGLDWWFYGREAVK